MDGLLSAHSPPQNADAEEKREREEGREVAAASSPPFGAEPARSSLRAMIPFTLSERGIQDGVGRGAGGRK